MEIQKLTLPQVSKRNSFINANIVKQGCPKQIIINFIPNFLISLTTKLISEIKKTQFIEGILYHENGQPVTIPSDYSLAFFAKYKNQYKRMRIKPFGKFTFGWANNTIHYTAKIHVGSQWNFSIQNLDFIIADLNAVRKAIEKALQTIGLINKLTRNSVQLRLLQRKARRQVNHILSQNQGQSRYDQLQDYPNQLKQMLNLRNSKEKSAILEVEVIKQTESSFCRQYPSEDIQNPKYQKDQQNKNKTQQQFTLFQSKPKNANSKKNQKERQQEIRYGGFCQVTKVQCLVKLKGSTKFQKLSCPVAKKIVNKKNRETLQMYQQKLVRQMQIIKIIKYPSCLATYIKPQKDDPNVIYMQYLDHNLKQQIYRDTSIAEKLDLCTQVIDLVICLHRSGVVHRDLKPINIMVSQTHSQVTGPNVINLYTQAKNGTTLKVIDFSQSALREQPIEKAQQGILGCTLPYSPLQCSTQGYKGYNYFQIDYWSVGVLIFQIFFKKVPISYSKCFGADIVKGWSQQFFLPIDVSKKYGYRFVQNIIALICKQMVKINPKQRMNLFRARLLIKTAQKYLQDLDNF